MGRAALLIGIGNYPETVPPLPSAFEDVRAMRTLLAQNYDASANFECSVLTDEDSAVCGDVLHRKLAEVLRARSDVTLIYFSGHAVAAGGEVYLACSTFEPTGGNVPKDDAVSMSRLVELVNESNAKDVVVFLDCCHSGAIGEVKASRRQRRSKPWHHAPLRERVTIITASSGDEVAVGAAEGESLFTGLLCRALAGEAADILGSVTAAGAYSFIEEALGVLNQRPQLRANVDHLVPLRRAEPTLVPAKIRLLLEYFPTMDDHHELDRRYEPTKHPRDQTCEAIFEELQRHRAAGLVEPLHIYDDGRVDIIKDMYFAAVPDDEGSPAEPNKAVRGACRLTPAGRRWWWRAERGLV